MQHRQAIRHNSIYCAINSAYPTNKQEPYSTVSPALANTQPSETSTKIDSNSISTIASQMQPQWLTVKQLALAEPAFSESSIRNLIFKASDSKSSRGVIVGNGLKPFIRRIGSKVIISHQGFLEWLSQQDSE